MSLQIFPYSLVRYAGLHHQLFDQLKLNDAAKLLTSYTTLTDEKERLKNEFCDALYPVITQQEDDKLRQQLINLKRQVFNDKKVDIERLAPICEVLPETIHIALQKYLDKVKEIAAFLNENAVKFEEEQNIQRKWVQEMCLKPELQNGLLLSSPLLYEQLSSFIKKDTSDFKQKEHRIMFSLLRYLSRIAFKTSPFSSFTYTGLMTLASNEEAEKAHKIGSRLKLNNTLFEYLKTVIKKHPLLNEYLWLKLNITAEIKADKICFLSNFNNIESFQQLNANGLQLLVYQNLNSNNAPFSLKKLIDHLSPFLENPGHESIKIYLIKLVEAGLLEMDLGFSGMDQDWDHKLLLFLRSIQSEEPSVVPLISLFEALQKHSAEYHSADSFKRYKILQHAEKQLNHVFAELQQEAGLAFYTAVSEKKLAEESITTKALSINKFVPYYFTARHIFYEDCFTTEKLVLPEQRVKDFVSKTDELIGHLLPLDVMKKERIKMRDFFLQYYQNNEEIALTTFYKDYYFHVKKPEKENATSVEADFLSLTHWKDAVRAKLACMEHANDDLIALDHDFFGDLPKDSDTAQKSSLGMFVQFTENDGEFMGVVNALLPGMGKVSGRFLSLFEENITESFVQYNESLHPDQIKVELNDASTFNANIHAPLLAHELELPGGNNIYPAAKQFNVSDLKVRYNDENGTLTLHQDSSELYSYDLSLESFYNRSNLYQLLAHFNPDARVSLQPFIQLVDRFYQEKHLVPAPDVFTLPRIVYAGNVVLRRKTWRVKTAIIPLQIQFEGDLDYFIRLNNWLALNKIPRQIFLFLRKRAYQAKADEKREGLHDDYKPQYLSFDNALLIGMFKKLLLRAGNYVTLEEVFPIPGKNAVREYLIQWYNV